MGRLVAMQGSSNEQRLDLHPVETLAVVYKDFLFGRVGDVCASLEFPYGLRKVGLVRVVACVKD